MKVYKKVFICTIITIIYIPTILCFVQFITTKRPDATLKGFFNTHEKPTLTATSYVEGEYQREYENWLNTNLLPRALCTKVYNQIEYSCFDLGNRIIGNNNNIFEYDYVADALGLEGYNYESPEKQAELQQYVNHLVNISNKLRQYDKHLILYITPSKAVYDIEDIPLQYYAQKPDTYLRGSDVLVEMLKQTDVTWFDSRELIANHQYPAFYSTGIHWARPLEQECTVALIELMKKISGKELRNIQLTNMNTSSTPYWRDSDVYDLLNVFSPISDITYYEYSMEPEKPSSYDKTRILLQGGSFSEGFIQDYFGMYSSDDIAYINYSNFIRDKHGNVQALQSWNDLDLGKYLDRADFVVIELQEAVVYKYSSGFVDYLDKYLNTYVPNSSGTAYSINFYPAAQIGLDDSVGLWQYEGDYAWSTDYIQVALQNENITGNGISLDFTVTDYLISQGECSLTVYVNQQKIDTFTTTNPGRYKLDYTAENFATDSNIYEIEIYCNNYFVPQEIGLNEDSRELSLMIHYIGEKR